MEGDFRQCLSYITGELFQSTPSAWRETDYILKEPLSENISIHSLRMEGDDVETYFLRILERFQSTPSAWRETGYQRSFPDQHQISIHSLRMEGDVRCFFHDGCHSISIHSLRMEGDYHADNPEKAQYSFQSTPSAWRETVRYRGGVAK